MRRLSSLLAIRIGRVVIAGAIAADLIAPVVGAESVVPPAAIPGVPPTVARNPPKTGPALPPELLDTTESAIDQELKGQFPAMERGPALPLGTLQRSWDRPVPALGQTAPGIIHYIWHADFIMGVRTRDFMVTTLVLPRWEHVNEYYLGDSLVFEVKKIRSNVVAVRSHNAGADSNLTVLGASGNIYNFYVRSETWNSSQISDITVYVEAQHPDSAWLPTAADAMDAHADGSDSIGDPIADIAGIPDYLRRIVVRPEDIRFDMKMYANRSRDADIAPERVFEDGIFTYFDFGDRSDSVARPVVHQVVDGVDAVVNTRTGGPRGNVLIAEATGDFTLRNGQRVVCVRKIGRRPIPPAVLIGQGLRPTVSDDEVRPSSGDPR